MLMITRRPVCHLISPGALSVADKEYVAYIEIARNELRDSHVSVQFDGWTTKYGNSYFGLVVTYMKGGELRQIFPTYKGRTQVRH